MPTKVNEFLLSLAVAVAGITELTIDSKPRSIFVGEAVEADSNDPYTVLRIYGGVEPGAFPGMRVPWVSVQADTRGTDAGAVLDQAVAVHEAFLNDDGTPWMSQLIDAKQEAEDGTIEADTATGQWLVWVTRFGGMPGIVGRDESNRHIATENFDFQFGPIAA